MQSINKIDINNVCNYQKLVYLRIKNKQNVHFRTNKKLYARAKK